MVRILANGDIVPDDDPRAQSRSRGNIHSTSTSSQGPQRGFQSAGDYNQQQQQPGQQVSIFQALNQKLIGLGIPPFNIGDIVIEPIVTVGLLLSLILFGVPGIIFGAILFAVSHWSQQGAPPVVSNFFGGGGGGAGDQRGNSGSNRRGQGWGGGGGGGHRLGDN